MKNIKFLCLILFSSIIVQAADLVEQRALDSMDSPPVKTSVNNQAPVSWQTYAGWADKIKSAVKYALTSGPELHDELELEDSGTPDEEQPEFIQNLEKCMTKSLNNVKAMFKKLQIVRIKKSIMLQKMREFNQKVQNLHKAVQASKMERYQKEGYIFAANDLLALFNALNVKINQKIRLLEALEFDFEDQIENNPCMIFQGIIINSQRVSMDELVKIFMNQLNQYNDFFDVVVSPEYQQVVVAYNELDSNFYKATVPFTERWARATFTSPAAF